MKRILALAVVLAVIPFQGCVTGTDGKSHLSSGAKAALDRLGEDALAIGEGAAGGAAAGAIVGATAGGNVDGAVIGAKAASGALSGAAFALRTLQGQRAVSAAQIQAAITSTPVVPEAGSSVATSVAPGVAGAVTAAIAQGVPRDVALELAATKLDQAAKANK